MIVHLHADAAAFDDGTPVAPEIVDCLSCDGPVTTIADTEHGPVVIKKDPAPPRAQRRWLKLRHRTCQFPGCHHDSSFDAHFPAGNPVNRTIEHAPFVAPSPADPNLITGTWTGEQLHLDWLHLTINSRTSTAAPAASAS